MNKKITFCFSVLLILATFFMLGFIIGQKHPQKSPVEQIKKKVDTLFIPDSNIFTEPKKEPSPDVLIKEIPVPVYVADSSAIDSLLNKCARLERVND